MSKLVMIFAIGSIWISISISLVILFSAVVFLLRTTKNVKRSTFKLDTYPKITIVVPAHNEELVIQDTVRAILNASYPKSQMEIMIFADNCDDFTYKRAAAVADQPQYADFDIRVINRKGTGGKAGVLNDALATATGEWICVYDADAMPERNSLFFLVEKAQEDPERYAAVFGRNKTRNYRQNFLTRCINLEIVTTQRIHHVGLWNLFKIGRIPGTNFIIKTDFVKDIGGWDNGALTEDTAISFKIMQSGKLIALAHQSEAFQQEPESLQAYYYQRKRWAKGNYEVILDNFKHLFDKSNWRIKLELVYYINTFFWFNFAIICSNLIFVSNIIASALHLFIPSITLPFSFEGSNSAIATLLLINWVLMFSIYLLQINIALASQFGQENATNFATSIASYFTYSQLFLLVSIVAICSTISDKIFKRDGTKWYKTQRFND